MWGHMRVPHSFSTVVLTVFVYTINSHGGILWVKVEEVLKGKPVREREWLAGSAGPA